MPPFLALDEQIPVAVAERLAADGFPVTCLRDRGMCGLKDFELPDRLHQARLTLCTQNTHHWRAEHKRILDRGDTHPGILLLGRKWTAEEVYWALRQYLDVNHPDDLTNVLDTVPAASPAYVSSQPPVPPFR